MSLEELAKVGWIAEAQIIGDLSHRPRGKLQAQLRLVLHAFMHQLQRCSSQLAAADRVEAVRRQTELGCVAGDRQVIAEMRFNKLAETLQD